MHTSDQSTSEENFEQRTDSRNSSSYKNNKKKTKIVESTSTDQVLEFQDESDFPQSIERTRYNQTNDEGLLASILDPERIYRKDHRKNDLKIMNFMNDKTPQRLATNHQDSRKKLSDRTYENSFDGRISIQTMTSKNFTNVFEYQQRDLIDFQEQKQGRSQGKMKDKDKAYFENHIIEHENEQDVANYVQSNGKIKNIELENSTDLQSTLDRFQSKQHPCLRSVQPTGLVKQKQIQLSRLKNAYLETINQNQILKNRVKQLENYFEMFVRQRQEKNNFTNDSQFQIHQQEFKNSVKIFRKFSI